MRKCKHMRFDVLMDWSCVKIDPNQSALISEKPHTAAKFGTDNEKERARDV